jgi:hypothetical protein
MLEKEDTHSIEGATVLAIPYGKLIGFKMVSTPDGGLARN